MIDANDASTRYIARTDAQASAKLLCGKYFRFYAIINDK